jgi:nicotinamidase-related amidase
MAMYGWETYLSERDKKHDEHWGKKELFGFGKKPALLLIDIYYSVLGFTREPIFESMKTWPSSTGLEGWAAVDKTAELLAVARANKVPVVHIKGLESGIAQWVHRHSRRSDMPAEMRKRGNEIVAEVAPIAGEVVLEKTAPSAFQGTPLMFHLNALDVDTLICCGETTSGCVRAASPASTASCSTSASRRRSSTPPSGDSASGTTVRSTCGWIPHRVRRPARGLRAQVNATSAE